MRLFRNILLGLALAFGVSPAIAGDLHQRVIIDDGASAGNDAALGTANNPMVTQGGVLPYTAAQTPVVADSGNQANAAAVATLPAVAGKTNYISGFEVGCNGGTSANILRITVAGLLGGTIGVVYSTPAGAVGCTPFQAQFNPPLAASAANTAIVVTMPQVGSGSTFAETAAQGFVQ